MFRLYTLYSYGEGVLQNAGIAQRYLMGSVNRGYSEAQYELGRRLSYDKSNPANIKLAFHYLTQAAKQGCPEAQSMLEEISRAEKSASGSLEISSPAAAPTRRISIPSLTEVSPELSFESRGNPGESAAASAGQQVPHSDRGPRLLPVSPELLPLPPGLLPVLPGMDPRFARPPFAAAAVGPYPLPRSGRRPVNPAPLGSRFSAAAAASVGQQVPHSDRGPRLLPVSSGLFPVLPGMDSRFAAAAAAFAAQQVPHSAGGMSELPINRVLFPGVPQVPQRSLAPRTADESAAGAALAGPYPLPRSTDERAPGTNTGHLG